MTEITTDTTYNDVIYCARLHKIVFLPPLLFLLSCAYLWNNFHYDARPLLFAGAICGIFWLIGVVVRYFSSSVTVRKKQLVLRTGLLVRQTLDIPFTKIESVDIQQSILGSVLHYGQLVITGTGGMRKAVPYLAKPLTCRRYIEQLLS